MRWTVKLSGEHVEGDECRERFHALVTEFGDKLRSNGFMPDYRHEDHNDSSVFQTEIPGWTEIPGMSKEMLDGSWEVPKLDEEWEMAVEPSDEGEVVDEEEAEEISIAPPETLKEIRQRIKEEKASTGGNKILSQKELAERIGVSVYMIKKALR